MIFREQREEPPFKRSAPSAAVPPSFSPFKIAYLWPALQNKYADDQIQPQTRIIFCIPRSADFPLSDRRFRRKSEFQLPVYPLADTAFAIRFDMLPSPRAPAASCRNTNKRTNLSPLRPQQNFYTPGNMRCPSPFRFPPFCLYFIVEFSISQVIL